MDLAREKGFIREFYGPWGTPVIIVAASVLLAFFAVWWDLRFHFAAFPEIPVGLTETRRMLYRFAGSIVSIFGVVMGLYVAVIALMAGSYGPRVLQVLIGVRFQRVVLGVISGTGTYALVLAFLLRPASLPPEMGTLITSVLLFCSLAAFFSFVFHLLRSLDATSLVNQVGDGSNREIVSLFPVGDAPAAAISPVATGGRPLLAWRSGYVRCLQVRELTTLLQSAGAYLDLHILPGDFVVHGQAIGALRMEKGPVDVAHFSRHIRIGRKRGRYQDVRFGFLQLIEIAGRALSPGINEPFTAIACVHRMAEAVGILIRRPRGGSGMRDAGGVMRLTYPGLDAALLIRSLDPIRQMAANAPLVLRELRQAITVLLSLAPDESSQHELEALQNRIGKTVARLSEEDRLQASEAFGRP